MKLFPAAAALFAARAWAGGAAPAGGGGPRRLRAGGGASPASRVREGAAVPPGEGRRALADGAVAFSPLSCNAGLTVADCAEGVGASFADVLAAPDPATGEARVPCGTCAVLRPADLGDLGVVEVPGGINVEGMLYVPPLDRDLKVRAPHLFVQGTLKVDAPADERRLTFHMTRDGEDGDDQYLIPHPENAGACDPQGCNYGEKAVVVAGGTLDIRALPDPACPTWVFLEAVLDAGTNRVLQVGPEAAACWSRRDGEEVVITAGRPLTGTIVAADVEAGTVTLAEGNVVCGATDGECNSEPVQGSALDQLHEVRCCADSYLGSGWEKRSGCTVWGESEIDNMCHADKTYAEAEAICSAAGARLCTTDELLADCTRWTGCEHDHHHIWSSTSSTEAVISTLANDPDFAAEVAWLSRPVVFDADVETVPRCPWPSSAGRGGHLMVAHTAGVAQTIEGAEFRNFGQGGLLGRYPIHFHKSDDVSGSVVSKNVIRSSHQRCVVIHSSHNVLIKDNVALNHMGHCYMLEDGDETGNTFQKNLATGGENHHCFEQFLGNKRDDLASSFWIRNVTNHFIDNVAAGSQSGFWFDPVHPPMCCWNYLPDGEPILTFRGNSAHDNREEGIKLYRGGYRPKTEALLENTKSYRNGAQGVRLHVNFNIVFKGLLLADNRIGISSFDNMGYQDTQGRIRFEDTHIIGLTEMFRSSNQNIGNNITAGEDQHVQRGKTISGILFARDPDFAQLILRNVSFSGFEPYTTTEEYDILALRLWVDAVPGLHNADGSTLQGGDWRTHALPALDGVYMASPVNTFDIENVNAFRDVYLQDNDGTMHPDGPGVFIASHVDSPSSFKYLRENVCEQANSRDNSVALFCPDACIRKVFVQTGCEGDLIVRSVTTGNESTIDNGMVAFGSTYEHILFAPHDSFELSCMDPNGYETNPLYFITHFDGDSHHIRSNRGYIGSYPKPPPSCHPFVEEGSFNLKEMPLHQRYEGEGPISYVPNRQRSPFAQVGVISLSNGCSATYGPINFGSSGETRVVRLRYWADGQLYALTLSLDDGTTLASRPLRAGSGFYERSIEIIDDIEGTHKLTFTIHGGGTHELFKLDWFELLPPDFSFHEHLDASLAQNWGSAGWYGDSLKLRVNAGWMSFGQVNFGEPGQIGMIRLRYSKTDHHGSLKVRLDNKNAGELASVSLATTGSWDEFAEVDIVVNVDGVHELFFTAHRFAGTQEEVSIHSIELLQTEKPTSLPSSNPTISLVPTRTQGSAIWQVWNNIPGTQVSDLTNSERYQYLPPDRTEHITNVLEIRQNTGQDYGSRLMTYIRPPATGSYTFWIASDDGGELWLSPNTSSEAKMKIAEVETWTNYRSWKQYGSQESDPIHLEEGQEYYLEAFHKEGGGSDHLSIAWALHGSGGAPEVIESQFFGLGPTSSPTTASPTVSTAPTLSARTVVCGSTEGDCKSNPVKEANMSELHEVRCCADSNLGNGWQKQSGCSVWGESEIGGMCHRDKTFAQAEATCSGVGARLCTLDELRADCTRWTGCEHDHDHIWSSTAPNLSGMAGNAIWQVWNNIPGDHVSDLTNTIRYQSSPPDWTEHITNVLEIRQNTGQEYGSRLMTYIRPPVTGSYTFWIASDNGGELWLSPNTSSEAKMKIAEVETWTNYRSWKQYGSQESDPIHLEEGQEYYLEALHKEGGGSDHLSIAWALHGSGGEPEVIESQFFGLGPTSSPTTAPPTVSTAPTLSRTARTVVCGATDGNCKSNPVKEANISELHEVRCCADSDLGDGWQMRSGCSVWGESEIHGMCHRDKTFAQAEATCSGVGARLCTLDELRADCTRWTGCEHDHDHIWSSTLSAVAASGSYNVVCGAIDGNCKSNPVKKANIYEIHEVRCCADSDLGDGWQMQSGCSVWGESEIHGMCHREKIFAEAEATCSGVGARLCTQDELRADCTRWTGCDHDHEHIWSSTPSAGA